MKKVILGLVIGIIIGIGCIFINIYNHLYIPTFTAEMNEIICIQEGI